jgi:hypothetical protein
MCLSVVLIKTMVVLAALSPRDTFTLHHEDEDLGINLKGLQLRRVKFVRAVLFRRSNGSLDTVFPVGEYVT